MELIGRLSAVGAGSLICGVHLLRPRRQVARVAPNPMPTPHCAVRFLQNEADLRAALARAARAERSVAASVAARADRYEACIAPAATDGLQEAVLSTRSQIRSA